MTRRTRRVRQAAVGRPNPQRLRRCAVAVCSTALVLAFVLSGGLGTVRSTLASWTDQEHATATFEAATIGSVQNLECFDSGSLIGLLGRQVRITWERPLGLEDVPLEYVIHWQENGLPSRDEIVETEKTEYTYSAATGVTVLTTSVDLDVYARVKQSEWEGESSRVDVSNLGLLGISVLMRCA